VLSKMKVFMALYYWLLIGVITAIVRKCYATLIPLLVLYSERWTELVSGKHGYVRFDGISKLLLVWPCIPFLTRSRSTLRYEQYEFRQIDSGYLCTYEPSYRKSCYSYKECHGYRNINHILSMGTLYLIDCYSTSRAHAILCDSTWSLQERGFRISLRITTKCYRISKISACNSPLCHIFIASPSITP
jgi:hypothetical protein